MELFQAMIETTINIFQIPVTIFGFTFSMWEVFLFSAFIGIVAWIIGKVFLDD